MNDSQLGRPQLSKIHSELDQIVQESESLIAEFQRITQKHPRSPIHSLVFFGKSAMQMRMIIFVA